MYGQDSNTVWKKFPVEFPVKVSSSKSCCFKPCSEESYLLNSGPLILLHWEWSAFILFINLGLGNNLFEKEKVILLKEVWKWKSLFLGRCSTVNHWWDSCRIQASIWGETSGRITSGTEWRAWMVKISTV